MTSLPSATKKELLELLPYLSAAERAEIELILRIEATEWHPLPGPQTQAYYSEADELLYGGAAGGGKTDLMLGIAHREHQRSIIFRREFPQIQGILDRSEEMFEGKGKYNSTKQRWNIFTHGQRRIIEFASVPHPGSEKKYQGRAHDLKAFDELAHFPKPMYQYLGAWNRTKDVNQRTRTVGASNPPTDAEGEWMLQHWGAWLEPTHPDPALPGELRYYTTLPDGTEAECDGPDEFEYEGEILRPKSRTFIPAKVQDNPYYMASGYVATLQALPEPLRSKMLKGDFMAGREDDEWQIIPTEWVLMAQARWRARKCPTEPRTKLGADVARGGKDKTVLSPRRGNYFETQIVYPGAATPDGPGTAIKIQRELSPQTIIQLDVIGVGTAVLDACRMLQLKVTPMNGAEASIERDKTGALGFYNKRAEWWWRLREALDPTSSQDLAIPDDPELRADLCAPKWKMTARGILVESKDDLISRLKRSPDKGDSLVYAFAENPMPGQGLFDWYASKGASIEQEKREAEEAWRNKRS